MAALAGAALVRAATGEVSTDDELGGVEMHSTKSGLIEYIAEDDAHGITIARDIVSRLNWNQSFERKRKIKKVKRPNFDSTDIPGIVPIDYKKQYDVRELVSCIVDGSEFVDFKPNFGGNTVCLQSEICGWTCGIIGNNGPIDPNGANKAAQFMQLCDSASIPLIFLNNTTGYMVGKQYEEAGMIKHGAKMIQAVSNIKVPKISLYIGARMFGAGKLWDVWLCL